MRLRLLAAGASAALAASVLALASGGSPAAAAGVTPVRIGGNPTCEGLGFAGGYRIEGGFDGHQDDGAGFSVDVDVTADGTIDFSNASPPVGGVLMKGGPNANLYDYRPTGEDADTGLQTPLNPNSGKLYGISHIDFCFGDGGGGGFADLGIDKTAATSYTVTHTWTVSKTGSWAANGTTSLISMNANEAATYQVVVDETETISALTVTGSIDVNNPNAQAVAATVTDSLPGATCTTTPADGVVNVPAGGFVLVPYTCTYPGSTVPADDTNTATVAWAGPPAGSAQATAAVSWAGATITHAGPQSVDVDDNDADGTTLLEAGVTGDETIFFVDTHAVPPGNCASYTDQASLNNGSTTVAQSAQVTLTVCRPQNTGGFTRGYWSNKNGQKQITNANQTNLGTHLAQYEAALGARGSKTVAKYVADLVAAGNSCAGTCLGQFRAQLVATALNVFFTPSLGAAGIVVPTSIQADGCATVNELLTLGNTVGPGASTPARVALKDVYDAINNNQAFLCVP